MHTAEKPRTEDRHKNCIYPFDEWRITEESFDVETNYRDETIFATGNGFIGFRGNFEEGYQGPPGTSLQGTYLNGFFESKPIQYGEDAYGYARHSQTMLNVTDSKLIHLLLDGEPFSLFSGKVLKYQRTLNMKKGLLTRSVTWESDSGKQVELHIERIVCLNRKHLAALRYQVTPLNFDGEIKLISTLNGEVRNQVTLGDPRVGSAFEGQVLSVEQIEQDKTFGSIRQQTRNTKFTLVCAMENELDTASSFTAESSQSEQRVSVGFKVQGIQGQPICLTKWVSYHTSRDDSEAQLTDLGRQEVCQGKATGFEELVREQAQFLADYWEQADVEITGDIALQQSLRFNAFQLLQSVGRDGKTNIAAKGVTGEGYEGHYFWDTETYIFPFFLYTHPSISRKLLEYRYSTLDKARLRATELAHKGALYAWRTINGEETSPYYPAGTAAYHINADIIYALKKYLQATGDTEFLIHYGAEMLFETARFWVDLGDYIPKHQNRFCINEVTGPDEYTALVNNNLYTNIMAKDHLEYAVQVATWMEQEHPREFAELAHRLGLEPSEVTDWKTAADRMYLGFDKEYGIYPQDDSFLEKAVWDFEHTPPENYPLLLHYHPLVIYRHQVLKQADVVLAMFLQGNRFTTAEKKRNYDYYEAITTHDSSLSPCIYSIIGAEIGYLERAYQYFMRTARMDLDDYNGNVKDGIHSASMAGAWLSIVHGFAGMRESEGRLSFKPQIPKKWEQYRFRIAFQGRLLEVTVNQQQVSYQILRGDSLPIHHEGRVVEVPFEAPVFFSLQAKLEAVLFDLDGVITDTAEYHYQAWKKLADGLGVPFDRVVNERLKGIGRMESLELILKLGGLSLNAAERQVLAERKNEYYKHLMEAITPEDLLPGIATLLKELRWAGVKTALASASKNAPTVIDKLEIGSYFDVIVDVGSLQKGKPDPEIFLTAADQLNVPYRNCIGIEDAESGVQAIRAAGIRAVGVGTQGAMNLADWPVKNTSEITLNRLQEWIME